MVKQHKTLAIAWLLSAFTACDACRKLPELPQAHFQLSGEVKQSLLYLKNHEQSKLLINITPQIELAEHIHYTLVEWSLPAGLQGNVLDEKGKALSPGSRLSKGARQFFYEPLNLGEHTLTLAITDQYGDSPKELKLPPITVEEQAKLPFKAKLQAEERSIYQHQAAELIIELAADLEEASSAAYTVRDITAPSGTLVLASSGEPLTIGSSLAFGTQHLLFQYTGEVGREKLLAPIKLTVSNELGDLSEATVVLELKPVTCSVDAWFRQPGNEEGNLLEEAYSVLEIALTGVDEQLHEGPWKRKRSHQMLGIVDMVAKF